MDNNKKSFGRIQIRKPQNADIRAIQNVVRDGEPYLKVHDRYIYSMAIRCWAEICAVAEIDGEIAGWCSTAVTTTRRKFFLHQTGVAAKFRRMGVAEALISHLLNKLKDQASEFELEFTIDRKNVAAQKLFTGIADRMGMSLVKQPVVIDLLEEDGEDELYVMSPRPCFGVNQRAAA